VYKSAADVVLIFIYRSAARLGDALTEANMNVYSMLHFKRNLAGTNGTAGQAGHAGHGTTGTSDWLMENACFPLWLVGKVRPALCPAVGIVDFELAR
jgi:hypothetical protein